MSIVKNAITERDKLTAQLENNPVYQKIKMLDAIIANFSDDVKPSGTKKAQIHKLAIECIREHGSAKLSVIHDYVNSHGMAVSLGMLKSYMYKYQDIKSSRGRGFYLKK